ncbi:MAG: copper resistance protein CopC [Ktedonobacterales bacterium]
MATSARKPHSARLIRPLVIALATLALGIGALLVAPASIASAHAKYKSSDPASGAILKKAPTTVTVHFEESVNPTGSEVLIYDANGKPVSVAGSSQVDRADLTTMTVNMHGDTSEIYLVVWHTVSADDGDADIGSFTFLVNPSASTISAVNGSSGASTANTTAASAAGTPVWVTALVGILCLLIGAVAAYYFTRSRMASGVGNTGATGSGTSGA